MPTSRKAAHDRIRQAGDPSVRPGLAGVRGHMEDAQRVHQVELPHVALIGSTPGDPTPDGAPTLAISAGAAALLGVLVYINALQNPFVYDDFRLIVENSTLLTPWDFTPLLLRDITRPLVTISYAIDTLIWGRIPLA